MHLALAKRLLAEHWLRILLSLFVVLFGVTFFREQPSLSDSYIGKDVSMILAAIPKSDREKLEYFFRVSVQKDCFGYVLLGEKPMALGGLITKINPFACLWEKSAHQSESDHCFIPPLHKRFVWYLQEALSSDRIQFKHAYQTWKKYEKFFPLSRFFIAYENNYHDGCHDLCIILINKRAFIQNIEQHIEDFTKVLTRDVNGEELLREAESKPLLAEVCMAHDGLIGILLGYGRENAFWFHQHYHLNSDQEKGEFCNRFHLTFALTGELGYAWTDEEFQRSEEIMLPNFRADRTSLETQTLRMHYLETQRALLEYYQGKDFLEATLRLLTAS